MYGIEKNTNQLKPRILGWGIGGAVLLCMALISGPIARSQVLYGSLTGTVTDASKAAVPNAPVSVVNQGTGATRTTMANGQGEYKIPDLQPGTYSVIVEHTGGFSKFTQKNVAVSVNQETRVDVTLQLSSVSAEVTIDATSAVLQTEDAEVNHNITQSRLSELPITSSQGRNFQALYTLVPGTANVVEQNSTASNPSRAMSLNVNGIEDMSNTTRIDGAINTYSTRPPQQWHRRGGSEAQPAFQSQLSALVGVRCVRARPVVDNA
jgi:hypothetical protein